MESNPRGLGSATQTIQLFRGLSLLSAVSGSGRGNTGCIQHPLSHFFPQEVTWCIHHLLYWERLHHCQAIGIPAIFSKTQWPLRIVIVVEHLFVSKSPHFFIHLHYQYCCCYCSFLIPLLLVFSKLLTQPIVSAFVPFSSEGCEGERRRLI